MFCYNGKPIKRVGFLGVGKSNMGVYSYLSRHFPDLSYTLRAGSADGAQMPSADRYFFADKMLADIDEDILFLSPSARRDTKELLQAALRGVILSSDCELFFKNSRHSVFGVTGSDGKSTTAYIASELLRRSGASALPFGNFGEAMSPHIDDPQGSRFVAELSSFQLSYAKPKLSSAVITNITKNHLNWHKDFKEYIDAKRNILENAERKVFNFDCKISRLFLRDYKAFAVYSCTLTEEELKRRTAAEVYFTVRDGAIFASGERIIALKDIKIPGEYNISNYTAAMALCYGYFTSEAIASLAREFLGLSHRREFVGCFSGISYYNSSIDSSPNRCIETLNSFSDRVILIIGGRSKGLSFDKLIPHLKEKTKLVITTGETAQELSEICKREDINHTKKDSFESAVIYAKSIAKPGDTVLLSPAATSYDNFKNFEERGCAFKELIKPKGN